MRGRCLAIAALFLGFSTAASAQTPSPRPIMSPAEGLQLAQAAGFRMVGGQAINMCGKSSQPKFAFLDLNADRQAEAVVIDRDAECYGPPGDWFTVLLRGPNGQWRTLIRQPGAVKFETSRTKGWVDATVSTDCQRRIIFDGMRYVQAQGCLASPRTTSIATPAPAPVKGAAGPYPVAVRQYLASLDKECRSYGGKPAPSPDLVKSADLTGDGLADPVIYLGSYICDGAASAMAAGQSGAAVTIRVAGPGGSSINAYDGLAYNATIETAGDASRVFLDIAGVDCGQKPGVPFSDIRSCSRPLVWNAAARKFAYAPLSQARQVR